MSNLKQSTPDSMLSENLKGSLFMVLGMFGFAINDTIMKSIGNTLNLGQAMMIRGCFASVLVFVLALYLGHLRSPKVLLIPAMSLRVVGELLATVCFLTALFNMPLANATAILQALPLVLTLAAAVIFREKVGWRRMSTILIGFIGVLIIVRPGFEGFTIYSIIALGAVIGCVIRDISTRLISTSIPSMMITLNTAVAVTLLGAAIAWFEPWVEVTNIELAKLAGSSFFLMIGYYYVVASMRTGEVGFVSPFRYSILLFAVITGYFAFGDIPDNLTLLGSFIVVASGIYMLYRERVVKKQKITPPPARS